MSAPATKAPFPAPPPCDGQLPMHFLVTSMGQTGAIWLAEALHMHPDILCSAGTDHPLMSLNYSFNQEEIVKIRAALTRPADYPQGVSEALEAALRRGGFFKYAGGPGLDHLHTDIFRPLENLPPREHAYPFYVFDELESLPPLKNHKALGNVRGLAAMQYALECRKGDGAFNGRGLMAMPVADLIRHPITRLNTVIHFIEEMYLMEQGFKTELDEAIAKQAALVETLETMYGADFSSSLDRAFFYVEILTRHSMVWADDIRTMPEIPRVPFEWLKSDRDYFAAFVHYITAGRATAQEHYLDRIFDPQQKEMGRVSNPGSRQPERTAREIYESWPAWHRQHVKQAFDTFDIAGAYAPFGYDLSYLAEA